MKIQFVQLPLIDHGLQYITGNIPNAAATLHAFCELTSGSTMKGLQLPYSIQNYGSDSMIVNHILHNEPTHVAFTCYLWNVERSLAIAKTIKAMASHIIILFGGPEIQVNSYILKQHQPCIDIFVIGTGEFFFNHYYNNTCQQFIHMVNGNAVFIQGSDTFIPLSQIVEPYTSGYLTPMHDKSLSVEIIRGCPFKCTYCLYSKNTSRVRALPPHKLADIIKKSMSDEIQELYLLAPTFNQSSHFNDYLQTLISSRCSVSLHTELRADTITSNIAMTLKKANFRSAEVGIQTLNKKCLQKIGRKTNPEKELQGIFYLKDAGINLQVGIIPGLPYDTPESFYTTMDTLLDAGLGNELELYPLMVLPGTALYDEAIAAGATFLQKPPYYLIEGFNFTQHDITAITCYFEDTTGFTFDTPYLPSFIFQQGELVSGACIDLTKRRSIPMEVFDYMQTSHITFYLLCDSYPQIEHAVELIIQQYPWDTMLCSIVLMYDAVLNDEDIASKVFTATHNTFYCRMMYFQDTYDKLPVRIFQVFESLKTYLRAKDHYRCINPIIKLLRSNYDEITQYHFAYPVPAVVAKGCAGIYGQWIKEQYAECIDIVSFEDDDDQNMIYKTLGIDGKPTIPFTTLSI